jgi:hypothetical protein
MPLLVSPYRLRKEPRGKGIILEESPARNVNCKDWMMKNGSWNRRQSYFPLWSTYRFLVRVLLRFLGLPNVWQGLEEGLKDLDCHKPNTQIAKVTVTNKRLAKERNNYRREETVVGGTFVEVKYMKKPSETPQENLVTATTSSCEVRLWAEITSDKGKYVDTRSCEFVSSKLPQAADTHTDRNTDR